MTQKNKNILAGALALGYAAYVWYKVRSSRAPENAEEAEGADGVGAVSNVKYIVYFDPGYSDTNFVWLHDRYGLQNNSNHATRYDTHKEAQKRAQEMYDDRYSYSYKGFKVIEIKDHDEKRVQEAIDYLLAHDDKFRYSILSRMQMDCEYYLGNGNRHGQYLWMSMDPQGHIDVMRALWDSFDEKPEWLTREKIDWYADQMGVE